MLGEEKFAAIDPLWVGGEGRVAKQGRVAVTTQEKTDGVTADCTKIGAQ